MCLNRFKKYLMFLHKSLNDSYSMFNMNERINDWYEKDKNKYSRLRNDLGFISHSLRDMSFLTISKLLDDRDSESMSVQGLTKNILSTKIVKNKNINEQIRKIAQSIDYEILKNQNEIIKLQTWRDKYFAHFDKKIINNPNIFIEANYNANDLIVLVKFIYTELNKILVLLGEDEISLTYDIYKNSIDSLFFNYEVADKLLYSGNQSLVEEMYKTIEFPKK